MHAQLAGSYQSALDLPGTCHNLTAAAAAYGGSLDRGLATMARLIGELLRRYASSPPHRAVCGAPGGVSSAFALAAHGAEAGGGEEAAAGGWGLALSDGESGDEGDD
jgi:hypothetical protein